MSLELYKLTQLKPSIDVEGIENRSLTRLKELEQYPDDCFQAGIRNTHLFHLLNVLCILHWGFKHSRESQALTQRGAEVVTDLFFGSWTESDDQYSGLAEAEIRRKIGWFNPLQKGLLLAALADRWDVVVRLMEWLDVDLQPEFLGDLEPEVGRLYIVMASDFRTKPIDGIEAVIEEVRQSRGKRPKLLLAIWESIIQRSQADFNRAMKESLTHFAKKKYDPQSADFTETIAIHQSFMAMVARHRGMEHPELPPKLDARLIRRETIELPASTSK